MAKKANQTKAADNANKDIDWAIVLINAVKQVGIQGTAAGVIFYILLNWTTSEQHVAIIDTYVLFRSTNAHYICGAIISALVTINIITIVFDKRRLAIEKADVKRLTAWVDKYELTEKGKN